MGVLSDQQLRDLGPTLIDPFDATMVQPASIDVRLDSSFYRAKTDSPLHIFDPAVDCEPSFEDLIQVEKDEFFVLHPSDFVLGSTFEKVNMPLNLVARFEGKSSLGRLGLLTHITAGFIDPGFSGYITVELKNVTNFDIILRPGMAIGQLCFEELSSPVEHPYGDAVYGSHYQGQRGPTLSRSYLKFTVADVYDV
jgi:dCTP deaminase